MPFVFKLSISVFLSSFGNLTPKSILVNDFNEIDDPEFLEFVLQQRHCHIHLLNYCSFIRNILLMDFKLIYWTICRRF